MNESQTIKFKQQLLSVCRGRLMDACQKYKAQMDSLRGSLESESKSTAGDKHETGRAMVQLEMERAATRWKKAEEELMTFERLAHQNNSSGMVAPGCLVQTDKGLYFLAVSLGVIEVAEHPVAVVSSASPIGQALKGKAAGEQFEFNSVSQTIQVIS